MIQDNFTFDCPLGLECIAYKEDDIRECVCVNEYDCFRYTLSWEIPYDYYFNEDEQVNVLLVKDYTFFMEYLPNSDFYLEERHADLIKVQDYYIHRHLDLEPLMREEILKAGWCPSVNLPIQDDWNIPF